MDNPPQFFVPSAEPDQQERVYGELAALAKRPVPDTGKRVYSITYRHNGEEWTATIGEPLQGVRPEKRNRKGARTEPERALSDPAIVLAIFPGVPHVVVTNHKIAGNVRSSWENPFLAGEVTKITHFPAGGNES